MCCVLGLNIHNANIHLLMIHICYSTHTIYNYSLFFEQGVRGLYRGYGSTVLREVGFIRTFFSPPSHSFSHSVYFSLSRTIPNKSTHYV